MHVDLRHAPRALAAADHQRGILLDLERFFRQPEQFLVGLPCQVGAGHFRHETDLRAAPHLFDRQILLQRLVLEAAHPPEHIELECIEAYARGPGIDHGVLSGRAQIVVQPGTGKACIGVDRWKLRGTLDPVLRARLIDRQRRDTQVTVVRQRQPDQRAQAWVGKEVLPAKARGGRCLVRPRLARGPLVGAFIGRAGRVSLRYR